MLPDRVSNPGPLTYESGGLVKGIDREKGCNSAKTPPPSRDKTFIYFIYMWHDNLVKVK